MGPVLPKPLKMSDLSLEIKVAEIVQVSYFSIPPVTSRIADLGVAIAPFFIDGNT
jgi:hypothetical protein